MGQAFDGCCQSSVIRGTQRKLAARFTTHMVLIEILQLRPRVLTGSDCSGNNWRGFPIIAGAFHRRHTVCSRDAGEFFSGYRPSLDPHGEGDRSIQISRTSPMYRKHRFSMYVPPHVYKKVLFLYTIISLPVVQWRRVSSPLSV